MPVPTMHPNTKAMLLAWRRMTAHPNDIDGGPSAQDFPDLLGNLFVAQSLKTGPLLVRIAGDNLPSLLSDKIVGMDFLGIWSDIDRPLASAFVQSVLKSDRPGLLRGLGETDHGRRVEIEIALAPLGKTSATQGRVLGLYQTLGGEGLLDNRHLSTHRLKSIYPPEPQRSQTKLRLVANNS